MNKSISIKGKRALVTGACGGIGRSITELLAKEGVHLVLTCRSAESLDKAKSEIAEKYKVECAAFAADLSNEQGVENFIESIKDIPIDILVNNAGTISYGHFWELPWDDEKSQMHLLVAAPIRLIHALIPGMMSRGFGRVLNVASVAGLMPGPYFATYNAAKAFLISFSESLSEELNGTSVTCGCLLPGTTRTNMWNVDRLRDKIDIGENRFVGPEKVAAAAVKMIKTGKAFHIVGASNKIKQFILRRLVPRTTVRKKLGAHCFDEMLLAENVKPDDYTRCITDLMIRRTQEDGFTTFLSISEVLAGGLCPYLAHSVVPYILTLSSGGKFPWMRLDDPNAVDAQCPNPNGAVSVRVKKIGTDYGLEVRGVRGACPRKYKPGDFFTWHGHLNVPWLDVNVLLEWMTRLLQSSAAASSPQLRSTMNISGFRIERENGEGGEIASSPCPSPASLQLELGYHSHRCRYHKWPLREKYDETNWIPKGLCPEMFHAAYPACLAMIYGGEGVPREITCPSGKVRVRIELEDRPLKILREAGMKGFNILRMNTEIPLKRCFLRTIEADGCPLGTIAGALYEFNMGDNRGICPAMFHNIYPPLSAKMAGRPFPWPELVGCRGIVQCPDSVSGITMKFKENSGDEKKNRTV